MADICFCLEPYRSFGVDFRFSFQYLLPIQKSFHREEFVFFMGVCIIHSPVTGTLQGVAPTIRLRFGEF